MIQEIPLGILDENPDNPRKTFHHIPELAATIEEMGLLQNLVVVRKGGPAVDGINRYELRAGGRRLRAMKLLAADNRPGWTPDRLISCKVLEKSDGDLEALAENSHREDLPPWEDGAAYDRIVQNHGITHSEIGRQIGKSQSHVSRLVRIARGVSPKLIPVLSRIGKAGPNILELEKLALMVDKDTLGPDHDKQRKWLEVYLTVPSGKKKIKPNKNRRYFEDRLRKLENMELPEHISAIVESIVRYLGGENFVLPEFASKTKIFVRERSSSSHGDQ